MTARDFSSCLVAKKGFDSRCFSLHVSPSRSLWFGRRCGIIRVIFLLDINYFKWRYKIMTTLEFSVSHLVIMDTFIPVIIFFFLVA